MNPDFGRDFFCMRPSTSVYTNYTNYMSSHELKDKKYRVQFFETHTKRKFSVQY
jgi:hypothetical protein